MYRFTIILALIVSVYSARATTGATVPWTTYEAENMATTGTILGPSYAPNTVVAESSGRECVELNAAGQYVQFTAQAAANSLIVRYSVPDTAGGGGANYTLSLYTNGVFAEKLQVTSEYSWLYGTYPFTNTPTTDARNFYDEVRTNGLSIQSNDVVRLEVDSGDTASYYIIDLVDLENTSAVAQPSGSVSITTYNAVGDGVTDCTSDLQNCINNSQGKIIWVPPGNYVITGTINLPSNTTIQGAGMWYATFVGNPSVYGTVSRRVAFYGNGSNIHLYDFAIIGKLNYRNDSEANDGLGAGGTAGFGTGSSFARIWVEHTKVGAWIVNSQGLLIDSCRFRDTIADGCNLNLGMQNTIVTNCTCRGTGDDCFAMWPGTYLSETYTPGNNVFTHCTGGLNFLANGASIDGGANNTVEDSLFQDMTYGCGILFSTHFQTDDPLSGTTVAQRCELNRTGGYDAGYGWRGSVQICMDEYNGIPGLNINNLTITNSASSGLTIIGNAGSLANAIMSSVSIPNYGLGNSPQYGIWAQTNTMGGLTVSNCTVAGAAVTAVGSPSVVDSSSSFTFNFVTTQISVTFNTSPSGLGYTVDGANYTTQQVFSWTPGSNHTIGTTGTQSGGTGTQYVWNSWSDSGAISHTVAPIANTTYTANFTTQYYLTMNAGTGGSASPASGWANSGANVNISATASGGYGFGSWTGSGSGSYSGANNAASVTMNAPITETAAFILAPTKSISLSGNLAFGTVTVGTSSNQTLTISNGGNATLTVSSINYPGGFSGSWSGAILAGGSTNVTVMFSPSQAISYGGNLTVNSDATSGVNTLAVSGNGFVQTNPPAVALAFTTQPGSATAGAPFGQQPVLKTVDQNGNPSTVGLPASLLVQVTLTNGSGALLGTTSYDIGASAGNGVVTFSNLAISAAGSGNQLAATTAIPVGTPLPGAVLWLDANDPSTLTTNGTKVQAWKNKGSGGAGAAGTNLWFTQNTTALQPWLTNQLNGRSVVTFNKNGNTYNAGCTYLGNIGQHSYTNSGNQMTYFVVARQWEDTIGWQAPVSFSASGDIDGQSTAGVVVLADGSQSAPFPLGIQRNHPATPMQADVAVPPVVNTPFLLDFLDNAGAASLYLTNSDGLSETNEASIVNGISPYQYGITDVTVGGRLEPDATTIDNGWDGDVAEVLVYNTALDAADQTSVENYLMNKWMPTAGGYSLSNALSAPFSVSSGGTPPRQNIIGVTVSAGGLITLTYATTPGFQYHIQSTSSLFPASWTSVTGSTTNPTGAAVTFTDPNPVALGQRYYRAVSP